MKTSFTDDSLEDAHNSYGNVIVLVIGTHKHTLITENTNSHTHTNTQLQWILWKKIADKRYR